MKMNFFAFRKMALKILPVQFKNVLKKILISPSDEYKWVKSTRKIAEKIKNEISVTTDGEIYLKSSYGFELLVNYDDLQLKLNTFDDENFKFLLNHISKSLPNNATIFDIGAYKGGYSLAIAKYFPQGQIYCFEPVMKSYSVLKKNLIRNNLEKIIRPFQLAVGDKNGPMKITNDLTTGNHLITKSIPYKNSELINSITLDAFVQKNHIDKIHFIKCDVEGNEAAVIEGAKSLIVKHKPIIYIEIQKEWTKRFGTTPEGIIERIISWGYIGYIVSDAFLTEIENYWEAIGKTENFLFISK